MQRRPAATPMTPTSIPPRSTRTSPARGRCLTDGDGRYRFVTIRPGAYPVAQPRQRLAAGPHPLLGVPVAASPNGSSPRMYFPGDPLLDYDPDLPGSPRPRRGRERLISRRSTGTRPRSERALGGRFDIVVGGHPAHHRSKLRRDPPPTPSAERSVRFFRFALEWMWGGDLVSAPESPGYAMRGHRPGPRRRRRSHPRRRWSSLRQHGPPGGSPARLAGVRAAAAPILAAATVS